MIIGSATVPVLAEPQVIWYELQYSFKDADEWFGAGVTADTIESARSKLTEATTSTKRQMVPPDSLSYRIVRRTITVEVVS